MYVTYGSTNLSTLGGLTGTSTVSYRRQYERTQRGQPDTVRVTANVRGTINLLQGSTYTTAQAQTAINTAVQALKQAVSTGGLDLIFRMDSATATGLSIISSETLGGVQLSELSIPNEQLVDFATGIDWSFSAFALESDPNADDILSFRETVQISGGGSRYAWNEYFTGDPTRHVVNQVTVGTMIQSGTIVGRDGHFFLPASLAPAWKEDADSDAGVARPEYREDGSLVGYVRNYRYVHRKPGPWDLPELGAP